MWLDRVSIAGSTVHPAGTLVIDDELNVLRKQTRMSPAIGPSGTSILADKPATATNGVPDPS
jgi:hypothetical protein